MNERKLLVGQYKVGMLLNVEKLVLGRKGTRVLE